MTRRYSGRQNRYGATKFFANQWAPSIYGIEGLQPVSNFCHGNSRDYPTIIVVTGAIRPGRFDWKSAKLTIHTGFGHSIQPFPIPLQATNSRFSLLWNDPLGAAILPNIGPSQTCTTLASSSSSLARD